MFLGLTRSLVHSLCFCLAKVISMLLHFIEKAVDVFFAIIPRTKPDSKFISGALLIAHRGAYQKKQKIKENTMLAFARAHKLGCWGIEFDVHCTADGVFVVNHDPNLRRLWKQNAVIAQLTFSELKHLAPEVPSLAEVVAQYGHRLHLFIELKVSISHEQVLFDVLSPLKPEQDYHLITLNASFFNSLTRWPKEVFLLIALHNNVSDVCQLSLEHSYGGVLANYLLLRKKHRQQLLSAGQMFGVGQINSKNSFYRELQQNGRWIFTNQAEKLR